MQWLLRYWKATLFIVAELAYNYFRHDAVVNKAVRLGKSTHTIVPAPYQAIVIKHMKAHIERIEEANKPKPPKEKFPTPYFYVSGKGQIEIEQQISHDFRKTYAYNAKVDAVMQQAGVPNHDTFSELMSKKFTDTDG